MRKVIGGINVTLDGFCDHTIMIADDDLHQHYTELLRNAGSVLYGRITYQLMEYWRPIARNPTGNKSTDDFAVVMDNIPKVVFSHTLKNVDWETARVTTGDLKGEVLEMKRQPGKDILVGSRSLIMSLLNLNLLDEFQLCVHPVIVGQGLPLFEKIANQINLTLLKTKTFDRSGSIVLYYQPALNSLQVGNG